MSENSRKPAAPVTIALADDHDVVRQGLHALLEREPALSVIGEAANGLEAVEMVERLRPRILVLDLMMPGLNGLEVTRRVTRRSPEQSGPRIRASLGQNSGCTDRQMN